MKIRDWVTSIIKGSGGFLMWEDREVVIFHHSREEGIADFVIRCLSNPLCEGSEDVLQAIMQQRNKTTKEISDKAIAASENNLT